MTAVVFGSAFALIMAFSAGLIVGRSRRDEDAVRASIKLLGAAFLEHAARIGEGGEP